MQNEELRIEKRRNLSSAFSILHSQFRRAESREVPLALASDGASVELRMCLLPNENGSVARTTPGIDEDERCFR